MSKVKQTTVDTVIIGAGPYGLSVAANLLRKDISIAIFGKPMLFWKKNIPSGMLLRSRWWANSLSDPQKKFTIHAYFKSIGKIPYDPLPEEVLCDYGLWFQKKAAPIVDETYVTHLEKKDDQFLCMLEDGRKVISRHVVLALGLAYYAYRPELYAHLPKRFVSHTCDNLPFHRFTGKRVAVIGGGQSAIENSALMSEAGIEVHLINRSPLRWTTPSTQKSLYQKIRFPKAGIADGMDNWILEHIPYLFQRLPQGVKDYYVKGKGANGPIGTYWLKPRMKKVIMHSVKKVQKVVRVNDKVRLTLSDGTHLTVDHIVLATGYKVDIQKLPMLDTSLLQQIKTYENSPQLNNYFESSIKGLYFTGIAAAKSFGPLFRFVVGADAAARRITQSIARR